MTRTPAEVMVGRPLKLSPESAEKNRRALRRARGAKTVETAIYREDPAGEEIEVSVAVDWRMQSSEPDVGIMSGYVEVLDVVVLNEDGTEGARLDWSQQDEDDFHDAYDCDLAEADEPDWDSIPGGYDYERDR